MGTTETPAKYPAVEVNDYGPDLKSLGYKTPEGNDATVGVLNPGKIQTTNTEREERITIISGKLRAKYADSPHSFNAGKGDRLTLTPNTKDIELEAMDGAQVVYNCEYINPDPRGRQEQVVEGTEAAAAEVDATATTIGAELVDATDQASSPAPKGPDKQ
jgi:uncharacterized protein YaiE (UPF0345 family)